MITYDYKYTEIELAYADFSTDDIVTVTLEIKGHRKERNKKFIEKELQAIGANARDWSIKDIAFKERQYRMTEEMFMKYAQESLF